MNFAVGRPDAYTPPPDVDMGMEITGDIDVEYGPLRLAVAEYVGKSPADVTGMDVATYEMAQEAK